MIFVSSTGVRELSPTANRLEVTESAPVETSSNKPEPAARATVVFKTMSAGSDLLDVKGSNASAEVLGSKGAEDASGIIVVATGDVGPTGCTCVEYTVSVPRAGPGKLDSWVRCPAADDSDVALDSGRLSDIDEVRIDSDGRLDVVPTDLCVGKLASEPSEAEVVGNEETPPLLDVKSAVTF